MRINGSFFIVCLFLLLNSCVTSSNEELPISDSMEGARLSAKADSLFSRGEEIYLEDCKACHISRTHSHNRIVKSWNWVPGDTEEKKLENMQFFLNNSDSARHQFPYYRALYEEYRGHTFQHEFGFTPQEVFAIVVYLNSNKR